MEDETGDGNVDGTKRKKRKHSHHREIKTENETGGKDNHKNMRRTEKH